MKKKLSYRDKLLELSYIYNVKEVQEYVKNRKNLTTGQLELILKKNKITIPKDFKTNFVKENILKPVSKLKSELLEFKEAQIKAKNKFFRKTENFKYDTQRKVRGSFKNLWNSLGTIGLNFLNIIPTLGQTFYKFFVELLTDLFNGIYNQKINQKSAKIVIGVFLVIAGGVSLLIGNLTNFDQSQQTQKTEIIEYKDKKKNIEEDSKIKAKKETQKKELKVKKEIKKNKKQEKKKQPELKVKKHNVAEVILPDLNLKTETVLNLFKDVNYDLSQVRNKKLVKPIYFTQFPKDLDELQSTRLKKDTFIKIVLPLVVAENERILADRKKLKKIYTKKNTTELEKQWLRQKLLEYKVKKGNMSELLLRMDIIPTSIALAQAAKESGWGTSRFALEGNAIFGQWTWSGQGIAPLDRESNKNHKILKFPILRASVKAYQNNLNTHKSYSKFREKRSTLRKKNKDISGLELTETLKSYAQTGSEYIKILNQIIRQNRLTDFEPVRLVNSVKQIELIS
ncbi:glucosaminidase domain-containing protein [Pelagibacteraceae bacterium]|jgi:Bax protein|nr:glucosaminidase domain-containing protein [Pelagibacteraceae bacterium]MDC1158336.1 glucosaminidase domain-containing protein [Pelagibacteraceae bacterium]